MEHECTKEKEWGKQEELNARFLHHILEYETPGGYRDRLSKMEVGMRLLLGSGKWFVLAAAIGGFIGGLLGRLNPGFLKWIVQIH